MIRWSERRKKIPDHEKRIEQRVERLKKESRTEQSKAS
jgi:hypothetical protein